MSDIPSPRVQTDKPSRNKETLMRIRVRGLEIPPVKDGLVIGQKAAIGADAMLRTLSIMTHEEFERLHLNDEIIEDVIIKTSILRKTGRERLIRFILTNLKPVMTTTELLMLDVYVELVIEDSE
jgi:hypothetical protein